MSGENLDLIHAKKARAWREWVKRNPEKRREILRRYYQTHKIEHNSRCMDWYRNNRERALANAREWKRENPDKCRLYANRYRERHPERAKEIKKSPSERQGFAQRLMVSL